MIASGEALKVPMTCRQASQVRLRLKSGSTTQDAQVESGVELPAQTARFSSQAVYRLTVLCSFDHCTAG